jgi:hypothetical protein
MILTGKDRNVVTNSKIECHNRQDALFKAFTARLIMNWKEF